MPASETGTILYSHPGGTPEEEGPQYCLHAHRLALLPPSPSPPPVAGGHLNPGVAEDASRKTPALPVWGHDIPAAVNEYVSPGCSTRRPPSTSVSTFGVLLLALALALAPAERAKMPVTAGGGSGVVVVVVVVVMGGASGVHSLSGQRSGKQMSASGSSPGRSFRWTWQDRVSSGHVSTLFSQNLWERRRKSICSVKSC